MLIRTNTPLLPFVQYVYILVLHLAHRIVVVWVLVFKWRCYTYHNTVRNVHRSSMDTYHWFFNDWESRR